MVGGVLLGGALAGLLAGGAGLALAQQGIYTCVDAKGRRLTSDRPILECIDREQKQLSPSGTVVRRIGPSLTAEERAAEEEKARKVVEERARQEEEKRRIKVLAARYPNQKLHDEERARAVAAVDEVIATAQKRLADLRTERTRLRAEEQFYGKDPSKVPDKLKRTIADNEQNTAAQQRFIANQEEEKRRTHARFNEELEKLRLAWAQQAPVQAAASAPRR